jgi:membrane-bound metal-dependent hydrolase YbcI (DUF457 family)
MFIGHNALAFAAKKAAPRASLGMLMAAPMLLDLLWPIFLIVGIERVQLAPAHTSPFLGMEFSHYPWSHSLLMSLVWGVAYALFYRWRTGDRRGTLVVGALVVSHWVMDFVTHVPDLPLWPGGPRVGLGLWNYPVATIIIEVALYLAGIAVYLRVTEARDRIGTWSLVAFVVVLSALYLSSFGPPPPIKVIGWGALTGWLLPLWAGWFDRHRRARAGAES